MPKEVPNISQVFKDIFRCRGYYHYLCIRFIIKNIYSYKCSERRIKIFEPLFTAADGTDWCHTYLRCFRIFWFVGIHGPSIVEPTISAITYANLETNLNLIQAGEYADKIITPGTQMFVATMGYRCYISRAIYVYVVN